VLDDPADFGVVLLRQPDFVVTRHDQSCRELLLSDDPVNRNEAKLMKISGISLI
jgi:hypothetical protein